VQFLARLWTNVGLQAADFLSLDLISRPFLAETNFAVLGCRLIAVTFRQSGPLADWVLGYTAVIFLSGTASRLSRTIIVNFLSGIASPDAIGGRRSSFEILPDHLNVFFLCNTWLYFIMLGNKNEEL
jgi:hypothetical protein